MALNFQFPIPPLRANLAIHLSRHEETDVLIITDDEGIAESNIMVEAQLLGILEKIDGSHTLQSLHSALTEGSSATTLDVQELASFLQALDEACLLESESFFETKSFLEADARHSVCDGVCYPSDRSELQEFLDSILESSPTRSYPDNAKAILAPHIDFRVDKEIYAMPFNAIRSSEFDLVVHIGTSHYGWQDQFIMTTKDFVTPLGIVRTDKELVEQIWQTCEVPLTRNDLAFAPEHSLEFHHLFFQHLFPHRSFTVLPILVTSFGDHVQRQKDPDQHARVRAFVRTLKSTVEQSGKKSLWVVSGDLAHVGRRFGDDWDAEQLLDTLRSEDYEIMNTIVRSSSRQLFDGIAQNGDRRRICGLPPVWTMLQTLKPEAGTALGYNQWNDSPTGTAVTYGSAAWW